MNRTALSVVGLAVGAVLIIALFNIYKPAVSHLSHDVFDKVHIGRMAGGQPSKPWNASKYTAKTENERAFDYWEDQQRATNSGNMEVGSTANGLGLNSDDNSYTATNWNYAGYPVLPHDAPVSALDFTKPYRFDPSGSDQPNKIGFYKKGDTKTPADHHDVLANPNKPIFNSGGWLGQK